MKVVTIAATEALEGRVATYCNQFSYDVRERFKGSDPGTLAAAAVAAKLNGAELVVGAGLGGELFTPFLAFLQVRGLGYEEAGTDDPSVNRSQMEAIRAFQEMQNQFIGRRARAHHRPFGTRLGDQAIIDEMARLRGEGASLHGIARALNSQKARPPRGSVWYASTVRHILERAGLWDTPAAAPKNGTSTSPAAAQESQ